MDFFRLRDDRMININQIMLVIPPNPRARVSSYKVRMSDGRMYGLHDEEARELLNIITVYSVRNHDDQQMEFDFTKDVNQHADNE